MDLTTGVSAGELENLAWYKYSGDNLLDFEGGHKESRTYRFKRPL